ncbi:MAG: succinate dehydrogenase cytochrome b subunit [Bacteroidales bacterium]|nr:succinate dehydrogenase cytochrome b subunit [Bacteroidales bacterium]
MSGLFKSSIGKKLIMSVTGLCLVLFLLFHMSMNLVAIFSGEAYNKVCEFLGTNWYALAGTAVLAVGFLLHIVYAFILTIQNRRARGNVRYAYSVRPKMVEWASQNMLILGIIVLVGLGLHFSHFWYKMMFAELVGAEHQFGPTDGAAWLQFYFSQPVIVVLYLVWFVAIWFHLTHGFWSAIQTIGWNNLVWMSRIQKISTIFATIICLGFAAVVITFFVKSLCCCAA